MAADHRYFLDYLADIPSGDLPALRHLLACPICQEMARVVLSSATLDAGSTAPQRRRTTDTASRLRRRAH